MNWLFWKEYRQNFVVVIILLLLLVVPHLFGLLGLLYEWHKYSWHVLLRDWRETLCGASLYSLVISQLALALIGGNAIAGERADRSAEFQVYLPLPRAKILAGKLLLVLAVAAVIWTINPLIFWSTSPLSSNLTSEFGNGTRIMFYTAITGLEFFCVAWFFSMILRSPTFSVAAALVTPLIIISLTGYFAYVILGEHGGPGHELIIQICYVWVSLAVALLSFGFGTWLYLRRVEA